MNNFRANKPGKIFLCVQVSERLNKLEWKDYVRYKWGERPIVPRVFSQYIKTFYHCICFHNICRCKSKEQYEKFIQVLWRHSILIKHVLEWGNFHYNKYECIEVFFYLYIYKILTHAILLMCCKIFSTRVWSGYCWECLSCKSIFV